MMGAAWGPMMAGFLASLVECVEALTIVLAVGATRGWRPALRGTAAGLAALALLALALGPTLALAPLPALQTVIGVLALLFGLRWLRKAILRAAGRLALRDEAAAYARETQALRGNIDGALAAITAFKAVLLEGLEVVFIIIAAGAGGGGTLAAGLGAGLAFVLVAGLGVALRRPLAAVPENSLKFIVGIMMSSFGVFWTGEGMGVDWLGGDLAIPALMAGWAVLALCLVRVSARVPA
jgi:uncharacterized membrane protein